MVKKNRLYQVVYEHVVASAERHGFSALVANLLDWCGAGGVATIANEIWNAIQDSTDLSDIAAEFGVSKSVVHVILILEYFNDMYARTFKIWFKK